MPVKDNFNRSRPTTQITFNVNDLDARLLVLLLKEVKLTSITLDGIVEIRNLLKQLQDVYAK